MSARDTSAETAPAKVNLALHVVGQRADGYHELDTLVVFIDAIADRLRVGAAPDLRLTADGPFAAQLGAPDNNLIVKAARILRGRGIAAGPSESGARLHLTKTLPVASGIGGGSADAAAALRLLNRHWRLGLSTGDLEVLGVKLGADVPMCVCARPLRAGGIGDRLTPVDTLPDFGIVLVNPGIAISTPAVFRGLRTRNNAPLPQLPRVDAQSDWIEWLGRTRNDLQAAAIEVAPVIHDVLIALESLPGCLFARMSGSGATCYALFEQVHAAKDGKDAIAAMHPDWWCASGVT